MPFFIALYCIHVFIQLINIYPVPTFSSTVLGSGDAVINETKIVSDLWALTVQCKKVYNRCHIE